MTFVRSHFLQHQIVHWFSGRLTVKDAIRFAAHQQGGVHLLPPKDAAKAKTATAMIINIYGEDRHYVPLVIGPITRIVLAALAPLEEAVRREVQRSPSSSGSSTPCA